MMKCAIPRIDRETAPPIQLKKGLRAFHTEFTEGKSLTIENKEKSRGFLHAPCDPLSVRSV